MTNTPSVETAPSPTPSRSPERRLGDAVGRQVSGLQRALLDTGRNGAAKATLARLRHIPAADPTSDLRSVDLTLATLPPELHGKTDEPSWAERAAHTALVLFAGHAQSAREPVHVAGQHLGVAVRALADKRDPDDVASGSIMARFHSLTKAPTYEAMAYHLRSLIALMRSDGIRLDYGSLARDLYRWQQPGGADTVRLRWGRGFHRIFQTPESETTIESENTDVR